MFSHSLSHVQKGRDRGRRWEIGRPVRELP
jgi:hypothetical protein